MKRDAILDCSPIVVSISASALTAVVVAHTVRSESGVPVKDIEDVRQWAPLADCGRRFGSNKVPVATIEFADCQCSFCQRSAIDLKGL